MTQFNIDRPQSLIWMDGGLVPWGDATLHVLSHGLNYSSSVFEGLRVYAGKIFKLEDHMARLQESARIIGFSLPFPTEQLCRAAEEVVAAQNLKNGYIRPVAWKGSEGLGVWAPNAKIHVAIAALEMGDLFPADIREGGIRLKVSSWVRPAPNMAPIRAKTSSHYAVGGLALKEAKDAGCVDALLLDYRGHIAESTGSNFFMVKDGRLVTPTIECSLDGITRKTVISIAKEEGLEVVVQDIKLEDAFSAEEAFLTGTAYEIIPIRSIDDHVFPEAKPVTQQLMKAYFELVGKE